MPTARLADNVIRLETRYSERELVKQVPGSHWNDGEKVWEVPLTWPACLQLRGLFGDSLIVHESLALWSQAEMRNRVGPATTLRDVITRVPGNWDEQLYDFQTAGAAFLLAAGEGALLGDDLGLGKTAQILAVLNALLQIDVSDALPALVICPNGVKFDWLKQIERWRISDVNPYVIAGGAAARRKLLTLARADPRAFVITNIESVRLLSRLAPYGSTRLARCRTCDKKRGEETLTVARCEVHPKELNSFGFKTVILDECHRIKDPASKQTRACWAVGHDSSVRRRWALTGTSIANHVGDLWSIWHFICPSEAPTRSKWVDRYALQAWNAFGGLDIVGVNPERREEFYRALDPRFRRTPKALVRQQLPAVVRPTRWVDVTPRQRKAYAELSATLVTRLPSDVVVVSKNNLVNATRKFQLASSFFDAEWVPNPLTDKSTCDCRKFGLPTHSELCPDRLRCHVWLTEPSPKIDALMEDIDALGGRRAVVAAQSRQLIDLVARRLDKAKVSYGRMTGSDSEYERDAAKRRFMNEQLQIMLLTIDAAGTGIDGLQVADTMFVIQRSWKMIANVQLDGRLDRFGSEAHDSVTIIDYVARDTTEETTLYPRLAEKWRQLEEINRDRVRLAAAGLTSSMDTFDLEQREAQILASDLGNSSIYTTEDDL